jgi:hypothetical protein
MYGPIAHIVPFWGTGSAYGHKVKNIGPIAHIVPFRGIGSAYGHKVKNIGPIAQLGARLNGIEEVEGSNPSGSTIKKFRLSGFFV